jgi:hypothetical protein
MHVCHLLFSYSLYSSISESSVVKEPNGILVKVDKLWFHSSKHETHSVPFH